jgi:hypothetical protein
MVPDCHVGRRSRPNPVCLQPAKTFPQLSKAIPSLFPFTIELSLMNQPPKTAFEYWVRFVCAALVFGFLGGVGVLRLADQLPLGALLVVWSVATLIAAMIAARVGDAAWRCLFRIFS